MLHPRIQVRDRPVIGEHNGQLQLCVPLVDIAGDPYRLRSHHARTDKLRAGTRPGKLG